MSVQVVSRLGVSGRTASERASERASHVRWGERVGEGEGESEERRDVLITSIDVHLQ